MGLLLQFLNQLSARELKIVKHSSFNATIKVLANYLYYVFGPISLNLLINIFFYAVIKDGLMKFCVKILLCFFILCC